MKTVLFFVCLLSATGITFCEPGDTTKTNRFVSKNKHPLHKFYVATGGEMIFSLGDQRADSLEFENRLRFSIFPHIQQQYHYNFSKVLGFYTGISLINIGFRHTIQQPDQTSFELRQRSMSFGLPLALKVGSLENGNFLALGCSAEMMFHYKYKIYYNDAKEKYSDWFSDKVNLFNLAVFMDLRNQSGGYIRFKYYLNNFLAPVSTSYLLPASSTTVTFSPSQSSLFYISVGSTFMKKKKRELTKDDV